MVDANLGLLPKINRVQVTLWTLQPSGVVGRTW